MHYYSFNIADYRKDTSHLTALEHGVYRQLLDWYYLEESPIPKETQTVIRRLRLGSESELQALQNVLNDFFVLQDNGYHQLRCNDQIKQYHGKAKVNKVNGKLGGRPKKTQTVIFGNPNESESKGNHKPITINQEPIKERATKVANPRSTKIANDWVLPEEWAQWAKQERPDLIVNKVAEQFKDHWLGNGNAKANWLATWRNWVRKERQNNQEKVYEAPWQKAARLRMSEFAPSVAAKDPNEKNVIDMDFFDKPQEIKNVTSDTGD